MAMASMILNPLPDLLRANSEKMKQTLVIGSRFVGDIKKSEFQTTFMRRFGISVISNLVKWTTGQRVLDTTSGYCSLIKLLLNSSLSVIHLCIQNQRLLFMYFET